MSDTIDIAQMLNKQDNHWVPAEGYVLVWEAKKVKHQSHAQVYVWGASRGGWASMAHAHVYSTYNDAVADVQALIGDAADRPTRAQIRVVKVQIRHPVTIQEVLPCDVLQRLAQL